MLLPAPFRGAPGLQTVLFTCAATRYSWFVEFVRLVLETVN